MPALTNVAPGPVRAKGPKKKGRCHTPQSVPRMRLPTAGPYRRCMRGCAKPRHRISSHSGAMPIVREIAIHSGRAWEGANREPQNPQASQVRLKKPKNLRATRYHSAPRRQCMMLRSKYQAPMGRRKRSNFSLGVCC
jgi:hypothetical protein